MEGKAEVDSGRNMYPICVRDRRGGSFVQIIILFIINTSIYNAALINIIDVRYEFILHPPACCNSSN